MSQFFERLHKSREARGLTRKQVADHLGITVRSYQYYEEGKREPSFDKLVAICQYYGVSSDYLLGLKDER